MLGLSDAKPMSNFGALTPEQLAMLQQQAMMGASGSNAMPAMPMGLGQHGVGPGFGMQQNNMQDPNMLLASMGQIGGFNGMPRR